METVATTTNLNVTCRHSRLMTWNEASDAPTTTEQKV
jgi:hypothetical protein